MATHYILLLLSTGTMLIWACLFTSFGVVFEAHVSLVNWQHIRLVNTGHVFVNYAHIYIDIVGIIMVTLHWKLVQTCNKDVCNLEKKKIINAYIYMFVEMQIQNGNHARATATISECFFFENSSSLVGLESTTSWWRHQMQTFSALLAICAVNSPVPGEFTVQRPVTRSFDVCFDLRLNLSGDLRRYRAHYDVTVMFRLRAVYINAYVDTSPSGVCMLNYETDFWYPKVYFLIY